MKKAIVIGHTGQDGTYLFQLLQQKGYEVTGLSSKTAVSTRKGALNPVAINDAGQVMNLLKTEQPDEVYFLAAMHHSSTDALIEDGVLFAKSIEINLLSLIHFLEAIRVSSPKTKLFYPGSSHVYGFPTVDQQDELTPFRPSCVYGIAKTAGLNTCRFYRDDYNLFACTGILFNHESPLRSSRFVSKKIVGNGCSYQT
jgi:GDPmannose 4,6-dehydratase